MKPYNRRVSECQLQVEEFAKKPRRRKLWKRLAHKAERCDTGLPNSALVRTGWSDLFEQTHYEDWELFGDQILYSGY